MPSWNRVIVSGSNASLNSLTVASGITGSLLGTASFARTAISASYALTASYSQNLQISGSVNNVNYIDFTTSNIIGTNEPAWKEGRVFYDSGSGALAVYNWEADVTLNVGQEAWLRARNQTGVTITNGSVVKLVSAIGDRPTIELAQSVDQTNVFPVSNDIIGVATHNIENGTDGFITTFGTVNGLNTSAYAAGDLLWVSQSAGQFTSIPPGPPYDKTFVGIVVRSNPSNGAIFVTPLTSIHFHDLSEVSASAYQQGDLWMYRSGSAGKANAWINTKQLSGSYAITGSLNILGNLVQGFTSSATGQYSHAEGNATQAIGYAAHAEGNATQAIGYAAHAEGSVTYANGQSAHAEGSVTYADADVSHTEGQLTATMEVGAHAEGLFTTAGGIRLINTGIGLGGTFFTETQVYVQGDTLSQYPNSAVVGNYIHFIVPYATQPTQPADTAYDVVNTTILSSSYDSVTNSTTLTIPTMSNYASLDPYSGANTYVFLQNLEESQTWNQFYGSNAHAEGYFTTATGRYSHAEGKETLAFGEGSHERARR